jgi:protein-S-isoprenylcysteine O-methyltransferase Ste14
LAIVAANLGPGWLALLIWALQAGEPDPRLVRAQNTKFYDTVAAMPLILWFAYGAWQIRPYIINDILLITTGRGSLFAWVQLFSLTAAAGFNLLLVYLLIVRDKPVRRSQGSMPRLCALLGTFLGVGIIQLPVAPLGLGMQILAALLIGIGSLASLLVLWRLGKSFSIMPEARSLVTTGPYAHARHPLYAVEMITVIGTALQFVQPWAAVLAALVLTFLVLRTIFEERVLEEAYPEYASYRAKTARFIPGVI